MKSNLNKHTLHKIDSLSNILHKNAQWDFSVENLRKIVNKTKSSKVNKVLFEKHKEEIINQVKHYEWIESMIKNLNVIDEFLDKHSNKEDENWYFPLPLICEWLLKSDIYEVFKKMKESDEKQWNDGEKFRLKIDGNTIDNIHSYKIHYSHISSLYDLYNK